MNYTDIEQSKKLLELGLNSETADMKYFYWKNEIDAPKVPSIGFSKESAETYSNTEAVYLPCWSLGALLNVMPSVIYPEDDDCPCWGYEPTLIKSHHVYDGMELDDSYYMVYQAADDGDKRWYKEFEEDTPFEAAYNMVVWLLEQGYK